MAITATTSGLLLAAARRSISSYPSLFKWSVRSFSNDATPEAIENKPASDLAIDLRGKRAFIAGLADTKGYGWAISKALAAAGAEILVGTSVLAFQKVNCSLLCRGSEEILQLPGGSRMKIPKVYALEAAIDNPEDVAYNEVIKTNQNYTMHSKWTVQEVVQSVKHDWGSIDIIVHSIEECPEASKPLLETSREGYFQALSASSYSYVSLLRQFLPIMNPGTFLYSIIKILLSFLLFLGSGVLQLYKRYWMGKSGSAISLTYTASQSIIPGYGGGMTSAKAALESDTRVLAFEAGRRQGIRVNTIFAGPQRILGAKSSVFINRMIEYSSTNAPLKKKLSAEEVGNTAAFLASPLASAITGAVIHVDNGLNAMGAGDCCCMFDDLHV
ncbi:Enoyl-[acyl-carrier-protein] reductase [NADH], chloroplastic [Morella rubra]|uniref:Enoyl-[acyl-carrier-protein] reductase [NADH], chloroplastic n=1 Tax=Morella rubra TaxID=262757 RepID=A0A6A1W824_9ROSI|nr:Enoyl-[acyl-carrier-protein] reductase [NADH], chloroplastic [Morella rubra]